MNQPPANDPPPDWQRPQGVAVGTWAYVNQRTIADHYDAFVADTPLCELDRTIIQQTFPGPPKPHSETILDLGCGTGRTALPLAELSYRVIGIDLSQAMLECLIAKRSPGQHISAVRANLVQLDCVADESADHAVCMFSTLGMIARRSNRLAMLNHVRRSLRPRGKFVLHVHNRYAALYEPDGLKRLLRSWWQSIRDSDHDFGDFTYAYRGLEKMFMHRFSRREIASDLQTTGFAIDNLHSLSLDSAETTTSKMRVGGFIVVAHKS